MTLATTQTEFRAIPLGLIDDPELPTRSTMDEQLLDELVTSIRTVGLIQPISVARVGDRYEVIAGHRRTIACKRAGLVAAPCVVYPERNAALDAIQHAENRHRENINAGDEAIWFSELLEKKAGGDTDQLAQLVGETRAYVEGRLLLFRGDVQVFEALQAGKIAIGIAHQLNKCTDELMRRYFLDAAIRGGATVAVVSGWVQQWKQDLVHTNGAAPAPSSTPGVYVPAASNYFTCACCGGTENVHQMQPVQMHTYCYLAIFQKLIAAYRGEAS